MKLIEKNLINLKRKIQSYHTKLKKEILKIEIEDKIIGNYHNKDEYEFLNKIEIAFNIDLEEKE